MPCPRMAVGRELFFELGDFAAEYVFGGGEDSQNGGVDFRFQGLILSFQVEIRDHSNQDDIFKASCGILVWHIRGTRSSSGLRRDGA